MVRKSLNRWFDKIRVLFSLTVNSDLNGVHYSYLVRVNGEYKGVTDPYTCFSGPNAQYSSG